MPETCPNCGLPKELCVCEIIAKKEEKIRVHSVKKRYGKVVTIIEGVSKESNIREVLRNLKTKLACGGTEKNNVIELQGDHKNRVKEILIKLGFPSEQIEIS